MNRVWLIAAAMPLALASCNTVQGIGRDIRAAGNALTGSANAIAGTDRSTPQASGSTQPQARVAVPPNAEVVITKGANFRDGPSLSNRIIGHGHPGERYVVHDERGHWVQIGDADHPIAWVFDTALEASTVASAGRSDNSPPPPDDNPPSRAAPAR